MAHINIAIDGYSSCGKSTMARQLAARLGYVYVDTGAMYRAVTLFALERGLINDGVVDTASLLKDLPELEVGFVFNPEREASDVHLNGRNVEGLIRDMRVSEVVSEVSKIAEVRHKLVSSQQQMGVRKGVVMDGRDIGTQVFPDAELKIFMTADPEIRAQRRFDELQAKGKGVSMDEVRKNLELRDYEDTHREVSPLRQAEDALVLDNSNLTPGQQLDWAVAIVARRSTSAV